MRPARAFVWFALLYQWIFYFFKFQSVVAGLCIVSLILRVTARVLLYIYTYSTFSDDVAHVRGKTHYSSTCRATALNTVTIV